jgi:hypothetical protein
MLSGMAAVFPLLRTIDDIETRLQEIEAYIATAATVDDALRFRHHLGQLASYVSQIEIKAGARADAILKARD